MLIDFIEQSMVNIENKFSRLIVESNWERQDCLISWRSYSPYVGKRAYIRQYDLILKEKQFSFLIRDGSIFQFYYDFDDIGKLLKAKLAFYPSPASSLDGYHEILDHLDQIGLDLDWSDDIFLEIYADVDSMIAVDNLSHVRLDFDSRVGTHSKSHLQFGALNDLRITAKQVCSPFVFFDFISRSLFLTSYEECSRKKGYDACLENESKPYAVHESDQIIESLYLTL